MTATPATVVSNAYVMVPLADPPRQIRVRRSWPGRTGDANRAGKTRQSTRPNADFGQHCPRGKGLGAHSAHDDAGKACRLRDFGIKVDPQRGPVCERTCPPSARGEPRTSTTRSPASNPRTKKVPRCSLTSSRSSVRVSTTRLPRVPFSVPSQPPSMARATSLSPAQIGR